MIRALLSAREFWWTLLGAAIGFGYNRLGACSGNT
jgi:hypothetical protein